MQHNLDIFLYYISVCVCVLCVCVCVWMCVTENPDLAQEHFEMFHQLAVGKSWQDESGQTYLTRACVSLCRVYTLLAERRLQCGENQGAIRLLNQAYEMAKEGKHTHADKHKLTLVKSQ